MDRCKQLWFFNVEVFLKVLEIFFDEGPGIEIVSF